MECAFFFFFQTRFCFTKTIDQNQNVATLRLALQLVPGLNTDPRMLDYCLFTTANDTHLVDRALLLAIRLAKEWQDRRSAAAPEK